MPRRVKPKHQRAATLEAELLRRVWAQGGLSRVQLARELKLAPSTAGIYVDRLVREGFLLETETSGRESAGRPPTSLIPNPEGGLFIGVDFEARNLMATAVDFSQQPVGQVHRTILATDSIPQILEKIERAIAGFMERDSRAVLAIGVGVPGSIDPDTNVAVHYPFIPGWRDVPLGTRLAERFGVPVFLENNIRSMALAELWFGEGRGLQNFVCVGIRSGIAAGVLVNGHLLQGAQHLAGEIGHWVCPVPAALAVDSPEASPGEWLWQPGARLEQVASLSALTAAARRGINRGRQTALSELEGDLTAEAVLQAAQSGDGFAQSLVQASGRVHGWAAYQLNELFNPEKIIFAGALPGLGELFLGPVRRAARELGWDGADEGIVSSTLGQYNGAVGAAALALHQWQPRR